MKTLFSALDWILNGICVVVAVLTLIFVARKLIPLQETLTEDRPQVGATLNVPGTDWAANHITLIMALQTGCRWCEASARFYQDLIRSNSGGIFHPIAVFPDSASADRLFLRRLGIEINDVQEVDFGSLRVQSTPTLILVNGSGRILASWVGMLSPESENDVFRRLGVTRQTAEAKNHNAFHSANNHDGRGAGLITPKEFAMSQTSRNSMRVVDIRPRPEFAGSHILGSLNIPIEELEARAIHEVPRFAEVVVYCHYCPPCEAERESEGTLTYCAGGRRWLQELGFSDIRILTADLNQLKAAGVQIEGLKQEAFTTGSTPVQLSR